MDNYTFYRFSKICELFVNGKDIEEIALIFHNTRIGNPQVDIFFEYYFEWWKKAGKIWTWRSEKVLADIRSGKEKTIPADEVYKELGL